MPAIPGLAVDLEAEPMSRHSSSALTDTISEVADKFHRAVRGSRAAGYQPVTHSAPGQPVGQSTRIQCIPCWKPATPNANP